MLVELKTGLVCLGELGAVKDPKGKTVELTKVGRDLARLPIEPRFGRMLLESKKAGLVREVMVIVAGLTIQDPRERPLAKRPQADLSHARFADPTSDFLSSAESLELHRDPAAETFIIGIPQTVQGRVPKLSARSRVARPDQAIEVGSQAARHYCRATKG